MVQAAAPIAVNHQTKAVEYTAGYQAAMLDPSIARPVSGQYSTPLRGSTSTATLALNKLYLQFLPIASSCTLDRIGVEVTTGTASTSIKLALYGMDASGLPGALILDAGTVATTSTAAAEATISQAVSGGGVWLGAVVQSASSATFRVATTTHFPVYTRSTNTVVTQFNLACFSQSSVSGTLPDPPSGYIGDATPPVVFVRFA